jgi:hypothetical protein
MRCSAGVLGSQKSGDTVTQVDVGAVAWSGIVTKNGTAGQNDDEVNWLITL